jgi:hypothetical protein
MLFDGADARILVVGSGTLASAMILDGLSHFSLGVHGASAIQNKSCLAEVIRARSVQERFSVARNSPLSSPGEVDWPDANEVAAIPGF